MLAAAATWAVRREGGQRVAVVYRRPIWMYRVGDRFVPGEAHFVYRHGGELSSLPEYERRQAEDLWLHLYRPKAGDVVVDIGAGIGAETQVFSEEVGPTGRVLSVEANPTTFARLAARVAANRLDNVTAIQVALVDSARPVYIEDRQEVHERNTVSLERRDRDHPVPVEGTSLDALCAREGIDRIDLLKLNIEGAERMAIDGMTSIIDKTGVVCIACHHGDDGGTRASVVAFLRSAGFDVVTRDDDERSYVRDHVHGVRR